MFDLRKIFNFRKIFAVPKDFIKSKNYCSKCHQFLRQKIWSYLFLLTKAWFESMFLDSSVDLLISLKNQKIQKASTTSDINIESRDSQVQQNISYSWFSFEQSCLLGKKLRYPLPRHSFNSGDLSSKTNIHENIGSKKFNDIMNFAKTWKWKLF